MSLPQVPPSDFRRTLTLDSRAIDEESRSLRLSFSSETREVGYAGVPVVLLHEVGAADFSRIGSALLNHDPGKILGRVEAAHVDEKERKGRAIVVFDKDPDASLAWEKVRSGSLRGVSVGFQVKGWANVDEGDEWVSPGGRKFTGPAYVARSWQAFEVSLTPIPADGTVGVGRSATGDRNMDHVPHDSGTTPAAPDVLALERQRAAEILSLANGWSETRDLGPELVASGATVEAARAAVLRKLAETRQPVGTARATVLVDQRDKFTRDMTDSLLLRAGVLRDAKRESEISHPDSIVEIARTALRHAGIGTQGMRPVDVITRAVGSHTSSDFPLILQNVASKSLQLGWAEGPATYEPLVRKTAARDFKNMYRPKLGDVGDLELIVDAAPMPEGSLQESGENYRIYTYGKRFSVSRAALVNDDLDVLSDTPRRMGVAARRKLNQLFWDLLTSASGTGPTMAEDGKTLFATDHTSGANYVAGAGAIEIATLNAGKAAMRKQVGLAAAGETAPTLNILPSFLVVPAALEATALQVVTSITPAVLTNAVPSWMKALQVICEPALDSATNGTTAWYLAASPSTCEGFEMAFLNGQESPTIITVEGTNILGLEYACIIDAGIKCLEHRSWYRVRGA